MERRNIDLDLTAVPEPGTWAAGILTVLALGWSVRKRFKAKAAVTDATQRPGFQTLKSETLP